MRPLIDCDVLRYEIGFSGEYKGEDGETVVREWEFVKQLFDDKVKEICVRAWGTEPPLLFLTMDHRTKRRHNKRKEKELKQLEKKFDKADSALEMGCVAKEIKAVQASMEEKPNFREAVAKQKKYKGQRKNQKPFHYDNLTEYALANYECVMAEGLEADDLLSIHQTQALAEQSTPTTVVCSRDKDLRITPGLHYGWAAGRQLEFDVRYISQLGYLDVIREGQGVRTVVGHGESPRADGDATQLLGRIRKVSGGGIAFFAYQLLNGDSVDNIPGLPGCGPERAIKALEGLESEGALLKAVSDLYRDKYGDEWEEHMLEQGRLLWMVQELDEDGNPVMWEIPEVCYDS